MSGSNNSNGGQARRKGRRRRKSKKSEGTKIAEFWGPESTVLNLEHQVVVTQDPTALVQSLGAAPLQNHQTAGEAYFQAIYNRAAALSGALGAAGNLMEQPDD